MREFNCRRCGRKFYLPSYPYVEIQLSYCPDCLASLPTFSREREMRKLRKLTAYTWEDIKALNKLIAKESNANT